MTKYELLAEDARRTWRGEADVPVGVGTLMKCVQTLSATEYTAFLEIHLWRKEGSYP